MYDAISVTRAKSYLGIPAGITFHDTFLGYLISGTTEAVAYRLGLTSGLTQNTYSDTLDVEGAGIDRVRLPRFPVQSVAALTDDGSAVNSSEFYLKADRWLVLKGDSAQFSNGKQKVEVSYVAGWNNTVPAHVLHAISLNVAWHFNRAPKEGTESERMGAYAITLAKDTSGGGGAMPLAPAAEALLSDLFSIVPQRN